MDPGFGAEDAFLNDIAGFAALKVALTTGLVDQLLCAPADVEELSRRVGLAERGLCMLVAMMESAGLVIRTGDTVALTQAFVAVLRYRRSLLEHKIAFLEIALRDVQERLSDLLFDLPTFQATSETFARFRYDCALDVTPAAIEKTDRWVSYVTALTESESPLLVPEIDLGSARRMLEIGGNSGAFAEALLQDHPQLTAVVLDLPAVCALGEERMRGRPVASRLRFLHGDARTVTWPGPVDAVVFKSILHDWPEADVRKFLAKAASRLAPGGQIVICERGPLRPGPGPMPLSMLANLVFAPFYRSPKIYVAASRDLGLTCGPVRTVNLDVPFHIVCARLARESCG